MEFKSKKNQNDRKVEVQWRLHAKIFEYRKQREAAGEKIEDADPILGFKSVDGLSKFLRKGITPVLPNFQTHDLRMSKASQIYIETGDLI